MYKVLKGLCTCLDIMCHILKFVGVSDVQTLVINHFIDDQKYAVIYKLYCWVISQYRLNVYNRFFLNEVGKLHFMTCQVRLIRELILHAYKTFKIQTIVMGCVLLFLAIVQMIVP